MAIILVLFGLPGAGKTYIGTIFKEELGFSFYDGDAQLTADMKKAIKEKRVFTDSMRNVFFTNLISHVSHIQKKYTRLVVAQTFIKEKYRRQFLKNFPTTKFILVQTETSLRQRRLAKRKSINDVHYTQKMVELFEKPKIEYVVLKNNVDGKSELKKEVNNTLGNLLL